MYSMCGLAIVSKLKGVSQYKLRKGNIELLYLQQSFSFQVFFCECQKKKILSLPASWIFIQDCVCISVNLPFMYEYWNLWCSTILWQQRANWHHLEATIFYVSQVMDEPLSWLRDTMNNTETWPVPLIFKRTEEVILEMISFLKQPFPPYSSVVMAVWQHCEILTPACSVSSDSLTAKAFPLIPRYCNQQIQQICSDGLIWRAEGREMTLYSGKSTGLTCWGY